MNVVNVWVCTVGNNIDIKTGFLCEEFTIWFAKYK